MLKNKTVRNAFLAIFCFFTAVSLAYAESCSTSGHVQYKTSGSCGTSSRTCCNGGNWSGWDEECPQCSESATSWELTSNTTDTCPGGDSIKEYQCDGSFVGTCTDIKAEADDKDMGSTSTFSFDPPSGYTHSYGSGCYDSDRTKNKKVAISYDREYQMYKHNYAQGNCTDISGGDLQTYDAPGFHLLENGRVVEWIYYGGISECPSGVDGNALGCMKVCNVDPSDNHGCKQRTRCYILHGYNTMENCTSWPYHPTVGNSSVFTCEVGAGGTKFKFNLKQCGFKYHKRTVTCCAKQAVLSTNRPGLAQASRGFGIKNDRLMAAV